MRERNENRFRIDTDFYGWGGLLDDYLNARASVHNSAEFILYISHNKGFSFEEYFVVLRGFCANSCV